MSAESAPGASRARGLGVAGSTRRVTSSAERRQRPVPIVITADELERAFAAAPEVCAVALRELSQIIRRARWSS